MKQIISKPVFSRPVCHLEGPNPKVCKNKHLLPECAEAKGKHTSLFLSHDPHY